ncbi:uncharacterized protein PpBr36_09415 [Pyricularia pennisetigena]|uniref:uncharacterized protein n=1 Tax=Pyricularia pennisetigena TaxID=1578925 RepID=UPI0011537BB5|nr:uncharacterized protein PpBr36_09415 [Pyricularia pennisetigena]TLS22019.1 hypothetical protein PpBr36_09415 [Pyricularia pennisetigena]
MDPAAVPAASVETEDTKMTEGGGPGPGGAAANTDTNTNTNTSDNGGGKHQVQQFENTTLSSLKLEPASSPAPFLDDYANNTNAAPGAPPSSRNSISGTPQPSQPAAATTTAAAAMPPKRKKKGTATTVKTTRKGGPSRAKSKKGGGAGAKKTTAKKTPAGKTAASAAGGSGAGDEDNENDQDAASDSEDDESDHGPYCLCRGPDDHRWMISCEACEDWFHGECVDVSKDVGETLIQSYICPRCTVPGKLVTRYKKTCGLGGCSQPARISDPAKNPGAANSVFCSQDHCNLWWEQLVATLPRKEGDKGGRVGLTQAEFMGLLATKGGGANKTTTTTMTTASTAAASAGSGWFVGQKPFAVPADFWSQHDPKEILTAEEAELLATSSASRRALADEVVLCRKMLQLLEMAVAQRLEAVAAGRLKKDGGCGYDTALDHVGAQAQFAAFVTSPAGQAIFTAGKLESAAYDGEQDGGGAGTAGNNTTTTLGPWTNPALVERTYMCERHRCKPHYNWHASHARHVHFLLKELAADAKLKLDNENRVRDNAAVRYFRKRAEASTVIRFDDESDEDGDVAMAM